MTTVHGPNEGQITTCVDIEFLLRKIPNMHSNEIMRQIIIINIRIYYNIIDNNKTGKAKGNMTKQQFNIATAPVYVLSTSPPFVCHVPYNILKGSIYSESGLRWHFK